MTRRRTFAASYAAIGALQLARLTMVGLLIVALRQVAPPSVPVAIETVQSVLPEADTLAGSGGETIVLDADGRRIGSAWSTSPVADDIIGFSGPSQAVFIFDAGGQVVDARLVRSGDTAEHVAAVRNDERFWSAFRGRTMDRLLDPPVDAVSRATLTSQAVLAGIARRAGQPQLPLFPAAEAAGGIRDWLNVDAGTDADVQTARPPDRAGHSGSVAGFDLVRPTKDGPDSSADAGSDRESLVLRTGETGRSIVGYQGPSDVWLLAAGDTVTAATIGASFDNEPYVGYVRDEWRYDSPFVGLAWPADWTPYDTALLRDYEGVSGATATSLAAVRSVLRAQSSDPRETVGLRPVRPAMSSLAIAAWAIIGGLVAIGPFRNRLVSVRRWVTFIGLGFGLGGLLSVAMWVGWARTGQQPVAVGLLTLTVVAVAAPVVTGRNVYCSHLCPHGAVQQLIIPDRLKRAAGRRSTGRRLRRPLIRWGSKAPIICFCLLYLACLIRNTWLPVDAEPFDAYLFPTCGFATIVLFALSLLAARTEPMAFCRLACPTGGLLQSLRLTRREARVRFADVVLAATCGLTFLAR